MSYLVFDIETTHGQSYGRVGNRWDETFGLCSIGWQHSVNGYADRYTVTVKDGVRVGGRPENGLPFPDLTGVDYLVGHNIKFDLLWYWDHPELRAFFKRGGKVWDTMYAEYLLSGQLYNMSQGRGNPQYGISLKDTAKRRNCSFQKQDLVASLWDSGIRTEDINSSVLLEYQKYDVLTTEEIFLQQVKQARSQEQVRQIQNRMDGMLATAEMEFNGIKIDMDTAYKQKAELEDALAELKEELDTYIPELPEGCEFKWNSWKNISALLFGGDINYVGREYVLDEYGTYVYYKTTEQQEILDANGEPERFKGGKRAGEIKTRKVTVDDLERGPKMRNCKMSFTLPGLTEPEPEWAKVDADGNKTGYYSTGSEIIEALAYRKIPAVLAMSHYRDLDKDLSTYYLKENLKGTQTGLLTNVQPSDGCVHGNLNQTITVTTRLSGTKPNLQNLSKKSDVKKIFTSRWSKDLIIDGGLCFEDGVIAELDYSQLEVVAKGVLSGDKVLLQALVDGICLHCDWLSLVTGVPYEEVYQKAKIDKDPEWVKKRSDVKPITFGEAYGAGAGSLALKSGLSATEVELAMERRKEKYPALYKFDEIVEDAVRSSRALTTLRTDAGYQRAVGYYMSPTRTLFHFLEYDAQHWQKQQGVHTSFLPTQIKNYPSQGLGGEIMEVKIGRVWRMLIQNDLCDVIKMVLTVHDSVYLDIINTATADKYLPKISGLLEDVCWFFNACFPECNWDTPFPVDCDYGKNMKQLTTSVPDRDDEWVQITREEFV